MEEMKRVLFTKWRVLLLVVLVLFSTIQFCKPLMYGYDQTEKKEIDAYLSTYGNMPLDDVKTALDRLTSFGNDMAAIGYVGAEFWRQLEYIQEYPAFLENIQRQAGTMLNVSIFMSNDETVLKTAADFQRMEGAVLTLGHDRAVTSVLEYSTSDWLLGIYMVVIAASFMKERKRGMWNLVCASPCGRVALPLYRVLALLTGAILGAMLFTGTEVVGGWLRHGGADELGRIVQSVAALKGFSIPMTVGQFWLFYTALRVLGAFAVGLVFWLFFELIPDRRLAMICFALFVGAQWVLYQTLPGDYLLDTVNLFMWLSPRNLVLSYEVLEPLGITIGRMEAFWGAIGPLTLVGIPVILLCCRFRKPNGGFAWIARLSDFWRRHTAGLGFHGRLFFHELHKLLMIGRGILVILAVLILCVSVAKDPYIKGDYTVSISLESYYRKSQGPVSSDNAVFLQEQQEKLAALEEEYAELLSLYEGGYLSDSEFNICAMQYSSLPEKQAALEQYAADLQTLSGIENAHVLPHWVYAELFGIESSTANTLLVISVVAVSLICILYSSTEASTGMTKARRATLRGRKQALAARYSAAGVLTIVICGIVWGLQILLLSMSYEGLPYLNAPICCLRYFRDVPVDVSILEYWAILAAGRTVLLCIWSSVFLWIADRLQK